MSSTNSSVDRQTDNADTITTPPTRALAARTRCRSTRSVAVYTPQTASISLSNGVTRPTYHPSAYGGEGEFLAIVSCLFLAD